MKWPWSPKHYDHDAEREKFLNLIPGSIPSIASLKGHAKAYMTLIDDPNLAAQEIQVTPVETPMSFLSTVGKDFKAVFAWLGSAKGQAVVAGAENLVEVGATVAGIGAPVQEGINLLNNWMAEIVKAQALGEAAAATATDAGNTTKAAAVLNAMVPQIAAFAQTQGASATSAANLDLINASLVTALNALGATTTKTS